MRIRSSRIDAALVAERRERVRAWCARVFATPTWQSFDLTVLLGGSVAKGVADRHSDLDLCVIVGSRAHHHTVLPAVTAIPDPLASGEEFTGQWATFRLADETRVDLHLVARERCDALLSAFLSASDIRNRTQELLWTLDRGIPCFSSGIELTYQVPYPAVVQCSVLRRYIQALGMHGLEEAFIRDDRLQVDESKNTIRKCLLCLGYALRGDLFWGFKATRAIYPCLPASIRLALRHLDEIDRKNWEENLPVIRSLIGITRRRLNLFLDRHALV